MKSSIKTSCLLAAGFMMACGLILSNELIFGLGATTMIVVIGYILYDSLTCRHKWEYKSYGMDEWGNYHMKECEKCGKITKTYTWE